MTELTPTSSGPLRDVDRTSQLVAAASRVLESLRPAMQADGGDVKVVRVHEGTVEIRLLGACTCCPSSSLTVRRGIEPALKSQLPWVRAVVCSVGDVRP